MRLIFIPIILIITSLLLVGCAPGNDLVMECTPPLIMKGSGCCLDADANGVCDTEEKEAEKTDDEEMTEKEEPPDEDKETEAEEEKPAVEEQPKQKLKGTQEEADKVGKKFATSWESKQYSVMYTMFTPALQKKKTADEFVAIMQLDPFYKKLTEINFEAAPLVDDTTAELKMTMHNNVQDLSVPAANLKFAEGEWKVRVFSDVFDLPLFDAACSGYRYNNHYKESDCAFDLAKKVNDPQYCNISACHYVECLKALGKPAGMAQEASQCKKCQPVGKTINQCILDVAKKFDKIDPCNMISEDKYNDRYCVCYGGFAKHKSSKGYCNMAPGEDYKELCLKGFEGKYC